MEKRIAYNSQANFRATEENGKKYIEGEFIVFNQRTELYPGTFEQISPEAVTDTEDVKALFNHNHDLVLGSTTNNTLLLEKTETGLKGKIEVNENDQDALNAHARILRGDVPGCSFGFYPVDEEYNEKERLITVTDMKLFEVSPCVFPAYKQTSVSARTREEIESNFFNCSHRAKAKKILEGIRGKKNVKAAD